MKKRRRAYKRYDWRSHRAWLLQIRYDLCMKEAFLKAMDIALLYGKDALMEQMGKIAKEAAEKWFDSTKQVWDIKRTCRL